PGSTAHDPSTLYIGRPADPRLSLRDRWIRSSLDNIEQERTRRTVVRAQFPAQPLEHEAIDNSKIEQWQSANVFARWLSHKVHNALLLASDPTTEDREVSANRGASKAF